jgi:hypothetical protein
VVIPSLLFSPPAKNQSLDMTKEDFGIVPLTQTMSKLTHDEFIMPTSMTRERSKSMTFATPGTRTVKPLPSAFNSTGILSKKTKSATKHKITPETPIKAKSRGIFRGGNVEPTFQFDEIKHIFFRY